MNHRSIGCLEGVRAHCAPPFIDDVIGHGVAAKMIRHVPEAVQLARFRIDFRVGRHGAIDTVGVMTITGGCQRGGFNAEGMASFFKRE